MTRQELDRIGYSSIYTFLEDQSSFFFEAGMMIDADGAYRAYHPARGQGLDYLGNAGKPGNWWALVTDNGQRTGNPIIQQATDPAPGYYISTTSLQDSSKDPKDPTRYVDSESVPFLVLPSNAKFGASLADFGFAANPSNGRSAGCVFADTGPKGKIGEGSIALATLLGIPSSPKNGGVSHGIVYVVFRGSKAGWPLTVTDIALKATEKFEAWGGLAKLKQGLPELSWA
jgi:hypothetical protein